MILFARLQRCFIVIHHLLDSLCHTAGTSASDEVVPNVSEHVHVSQPFLHANDVWWVWPAQHCLQLLHSGLRVLREAGKELYVHCRDYQRLRRIRLGRRTRTCYTQRPASFLGTTKSTGLRSKRRKVGRRRLILLSIRVRRRTRALNSKSPSPRLRTGRRRCHGGPRTKAAPRLRDGGRS